MMRRIVFVSGNKGKVAEVGKIIASKIPNLSIDAFDIDCKKDFEFRFSC
jgi:inosine/xanthosine triphosphate pyrophosphatase family protein